MQSYAKSYLEVDNIVFSCFFEMSRFEQLCYRPPCGSYLRRFPSQDQERLNDQYTNKNSDGYAIIDHRDDGDDSDEFEYPNHSIYTNKLSLFKTANGLCGTNKDQNK